MSKEKPTPQELIDQAVSLSDKIANGMGDLIKETSKLSDEEKAGLIESESFKDLSDSIRGLNDELDNFDNFKK